MPRTQLKGLAAVGVLAPMLGMASSASAGSPHWYMVAAACLQVPIAALQWVTASVPRPSRALIRLTIVATVLSCVIGAALSLHRAGSPTTVVVFGLILPVAVAALIIAAVRSIASETP